MSGPEDGRKKGQNPWVKAGVFGALGIEFVATAVAGVWLGQFLDERWDIEPIGTIVCLILAFVGAGVHTVVITKRFVDSDD